MFLIDYQLFSIFLPDGRGHSRLRPDDDAETVAESVGAESTAGSTTELVKPWRPGVRRQTSLTQVGPTQTLMHVQAPRAAPGDRPLSPESRGGFRPLSAQSQGSVTSGGFQHQGGHHSQQPEVLDFVTGAHSTVPMPSDSEADSVSMTSSAFGSQFELIRSGSRSSRPSSSRGGIADVSIA